LEAETISGTSDGRRIRVFFDEWDIEKSENIVVRLGEGLASGAFVAVIMSPEFFASDWTRFEWTDVVARDPANRGGRLLALRLRDLALDGTRRLALPAPSRSPRYPLVGWSTARNSYPHLLAGERDKHAPAFLKSSNFR
jgi:hypothetical protein